MTDTIDQASELEQRERDAAIRHATAPKGPGAPECDYCGEEISPLRQSMGARLCIECQRVVETSQKHRARR